MRPLRLATVSRNYFNLPIWIALHQGCFAAEGLDVTLEIHEPIDAVYERLRDGHVQFACGVTEHVILDRERGGWQEILAGNVNKLPFSFIGARHISSIGDLRGGTIGVSSIEAGSSSLILKMLAAHGLEYPRDYKLLACGPILARWEKLQSGEIDAGLQGVPLNHIAIDAGYTDLGDPRALFPDFQFTSLNVDRRWASNTATRQSASCAPGSAPIAGSSPTGKGPTASRWRRPACPNITRTALGGNARKREFSPPMAAPAFSPCRR